MIVTVPNGSSLEVRDAAGTVVRSTGDSVLPFNSGAVPLAFGGLVYCGFGLTAVEAAMSWLNPGVDVRYAKLLGVVSPNTFNGNTAITLRSNGAGTAMTITIPAGSVLAVASLASVLIAAGNVMSLEIDTTGSAAGAGTFAGSLVLATV